MRYNFHKSNTLVTLKTRGQEMNLSVVSLYSGAGGLDCGFSSAGNDIRLCVEIDADSCSTLRRNTKSLVIESSIEKVSGKDLLTNGGFKKRELDILVGGPPCQPFSKSGYWVSGDTARLDDPRAHTLYQYMRVVRDTLPKVFIIENVAGLAYENKSEGLDYILRSVHYINRISKTNYKISWKILNAVDYGVPQRRERIFIVGCRNGMPFNFPNATHSEHNRNLLRASTAWDAIGHMKSETDLSEYEVKGKWAKLLPTIPEGQNYLWHTEKGGGLPIFEWRSRYWNFLLKLAKNQPSWTILAQPGTSTGPFHWDNRRLTPSEVAAIQTFPTDYKFVGSRKSVQRQIGNAVPSALAEIIALEIRKQCFQGDSRRTPKLIPIKRRILPPPRRTSSTRTIQSFLD